MGKPSIYIETSIVSYLAARQSRDLVTAACQRVTAEWWEDRRPEYDLFTSELVIAEARAGDPETAAKRLELLRGIPELAITDNVKRLAAALIAPNALPQKAQADAVHISVPALHQVEYLLTWNCRHIDNPVTKPVVRAICDTEGFSCPEICTPMEIMEINRDER